VSVAVFFNGRRRGIAEEGAQAGSGPERIVAPMPGKIVRVLVASGEPVRARQPVVVIEAMKMENELRAGRDGTVVEIHAVEGQSVDAGVLLAVIDAGAR
jgi:biotin carboxyl carrier protein